MSSYFVPIKPASLSWQNGLPYSSIYDDVYSSRQGAKAQSLHVFVGGNDLIQRWSALPDRQDSLFHIGETGFGTGLNFLLAWMLWEQHAPKNARLHFFSCELHPLRREDLAHCLAVIPELSEYADALLDSYPVLTPGYHHLSFSEGRVNLTLMLGDAYECYEQLLVSGDAAVEHHLRPYAFDAWYLDGFAPARNEGMWSEPLLKTIGLLSKPGTTFATYTSSSSVKNNLILAGFKIQKRKGFAYKRHMLTGVMEQTPTLRLKTRHTPWQTPARAGNLSVHEAIIIGAGLAGAFMASSLAKRGWRVRVIERESVGQGASGNQRAVLFPNFSAYKSPMTQLMLSGYVHAVRTYRQLLREHPIGALCGMLMAAFNENEARAQEQLSAWLAAYPDLAQQLSPEEASNRCGINLPYGGLWVPDSGWLDSPKLCELLLHHPLITVQTGVTADVLDFEDSRWHVAGMAAPVVILANGFEANRFNQTKILPIKPIRGQMSLIPATTSSGGLRVPLCGEGHVLPSIDGIHYVGASYDLGNAEAILKSADDTDNHYKISRLAPGIDWSATIIESWAGVRGSTPDYVPLVGPVPIESEFIERFQGLSSNAKRWIPQAGAYHPGLYAFAGFGSRGVTTIPLTAEWLAGQLNGEASILPRQMIQSLSPARFIRKKIIRG